MTKYSEAALVSRINETLYSNNMNEIDALEMRQLMVDFLDSLQLRGVQAGSIPVYSGEIINSQLDENKKIIINHNLSTNLSLLFIFNNLGQQLGDIYYTCTLQDENSIEIEFEDNIPAGVAYKYIIAKLIEDINPEIEYHLTFKEDFENWVGTGWNTIPVDWYFTSNPETIGEFNRIYNDNNSARIIYEMEYYNTQKLLSNCLLAPGINYKITIRYKTNTVPGTNIEFFHYGIDNGTEVQEIKRWLDDTSGQWNELILNFIPVINEGEFFLKFVVDGGFEYNFNIDSIKIEIV